MNTDYFYENRPLGFVTENGEFIEGDWGHHHLVAIDMLNRLGIHYEASTRDPEDLLIYNLGWILIHLDDGDSVRVSYCGHINEVQEDFLKKYAEEYNARFRFHEIYF